MRIDVPLAPNAMGCPRALTFINFVPRPIRKDFLHAPVGHLVKGIAVDEVPEGLFVGPFAGDEGGGAVTNVFS